ncbi:hypothetical protein [uncultured Maribacter sp.]|uniref:hypothetical protein n=1 Tax=uncultured Maribacter sp. TaxID=431308 RepID=UPI0026367780|nr:hypothetical protein [uncultured Maribacter sp.]
MDKVVIISSLYFEKDNQIIKFPTSKKEIKANLSTEILKTAKEEKLSLKKEEDIIKLFQLLK